MNSAYRRLSYFTLLMVMPHLSWALEVELSISTELMASEARVYQSSQALIKAIEASENEEALAEAFLECPEDNSPQFKVNFVRLNSMWLMGSKSIDDKRYSGVISYVLKCKHDRRRGGDR
jgi:hypothetical protein